MLLLKTNICLIETNICLIVNKEVSRIFLWKNSSNSSLFLLGYKCLLGPNL